MAQLEGVPSEFGTTLAGQYAEVNARAEQSFHFGPGALIPSNLSKDIINVVCVDGGAAAGGDGRTFATAWQTIALGLAAAGTSDYVFVRNGGMAEREYDVNAVAGHAINKRVFLVGETTMMHQRVSRNLARLGYAGAGVSYNAQAFAPKLTNSNGGATYVVDVSASCVISGFVVDGERADKTCMRIVGSNVLVQVYDCQFGNIEGVGRYMLFMDYTGAQPLIAQFYGCDFIGEPAGGAGTSHFNVEAGALASFDHCRFEYETASSQCPGNVEAYDCVFLRCMPIALSGAFMHHRCVWQNVTGGNLPFIGSNLSFLEGDDSEVNNAEFDAVMTAGAGTAELVVYMDTTGGNNVGPYSMGARGFSITFDVVHLLADSGRFRVLMEEYGTNSGRYTPVAEDVFDIDYYNAMLVAGRTVPMPSLTIMPAVTRGTMYRLKFQMLDAAVGDDRTIHCKYKS